MPVFALRTMTSQQQPDLLLHSDVKQNFIFFRTKQPRGNLAAKMGKVRILDYSI